MKIFTIGFTQRNAQQFFNDLKQPGLVRVLDTRFNNNNQLAGFTKRDDLRFFLHQLNNLDYQHRIDLAPTQEMLKEARENKSFSAYEKRFNELMVERSIENLPRELIDGACLLCSERKPHECHRRLVAEYLQQKWGDVEIIHL